MIRTLLEVIGASQIRMQKNGGHNLMATMKHLLWAWLGLLSLILVAQPAIGQSRIYYTATDQTTALMSPGTINFPDGNVHIRGAVVQTRVTSSLFSGTMIVTLNANWNSKFCGPIWGTFVLTLDNGGVWEGTWVGKRALAAEGWSASLVAEGYGTGPGIEGMHMKETETAVSTTPIPFPYTGSVSGYIF